LANKFYVTNQHGGPEEEGYVLYGDSSIGAITGIVADPDQTFLIPTVIAVSPDRTKAYVANTSNPITVIDITTNAVTGTITNGNINVTAIAFSPDGSKAYVANAISTVSVINVANDANNAITRNVIVPNFTNPLSIAFTTDGSNKAYVVNNGTPGSVSVINTVTDTVVTANGGFVYDLNTFYNSTCVAITPDSTTAYVTNDQTPCTVSIINVAENVVTGTVYDPTGAITNPMFVAFTPDGTTAYVANGSNNSVNVIDVATHTVVDTISNNPNYPYFNDDNSLAITPDGQYVYVVNNGGNSISILGVSDNAPLGYVGNKSIYTLTDPAFVAFVPSQPTPPGATPFALRFIQKYGGA